MKKIIVTGATSMIGVAIIEEALKHDLETIYAVVRKGCLKLDRLAEDERIKIVECDIDNYSTLSSKINDTCEVFYNIAWAATGPKRNENILALSKNIVYTIDAMHAAKALGCKKFIGAGSQAEYGNLDIDKIAPNSPINPVQAYGAAKYAAGKLALMEAEKLDMDCIWVRIFSVYGKYDKPSTMISSSIRKMLSGEKALFTKGEQMWDYLYSSDAGKAFFMIGEKSLGKKVYCLGSGNAMPLYEYIKVIRNTVNKNAEIGLGEIPYKSDTIMHLCADITELKKDTGWEPKTPFEDGIRRIKDSLSKEI